MIPQTRAALVASGKLYVMENVPGAPLYSPMTLCGTEFNLSVIVNGQRRWLRRHRLFESNALLMGPGTPCTCGRRLIAGVYGHGQKSANQYIRGFPLQASLAREIMGTPWMSRDEVSQAIPPAYTEFIGRQLIQQLKR
jgi:DNA (cytosine-5)-methyltransferase 1